jgi:DNA-3-methyladenine glycosylase II
LLNDPAPAGFFVLSMKEDHLKLLRRDKVLGRVIKEIGLIKIKKRPDLYLALMRAIVGQQLSVKAAATIWERFLALFPAKYPQASEVLAIDVNQLRGAGLSFQKAGYLRNIAEFSLSQTLDYKKLKSKSDEELIEYLTEIKGVGRWTVEMILMFNLGRADVFPIDDLGIQNGMVHMYQLKAANKKVLLTKMQKIAEQWKPYRTHACMYIWQYKDNLPNKKA